MDISVIISTYNSPQWLKKVIWGYEAQEFKDFELIIADDGSGDETRELIKTFKQNSKLLIRHQWHEDRGFRKCAIMNAAIREASGQYLVFSDGDCIPRSDFLTQHANFREKGYFLSGGYSKLNMEGSLGISREQIASGEAFDPEFLHNCGLAKKWSSKHSAGGKWATVMNFLTPTKPTWNGHNASCWKSDALEVNGFDQRMEYGGEDREFGERLFNLGLKSKQIRYSAICIHLDHARGYVTQEGIQLNKSIRAETAKSGRVRCEQGIVS